VSDQPRHHYLDGGLCQCGQAHGAHAATCEGVVSDAIDTALIHGLFPEPVLRRQLLRSVGAATLLGALSALLPVDALKAIAQEKKPLEKTKLNVGFLPITCAAPLIYGGGDRQLQQRRPSGRVAEDCRHRADPRQDAQRRA